MRHGRTLGRLASWFVCALVVIGLTGIAVAAAPVVKTVPWVATNPLIPHDTYAGKSITLKVRPTSKGRHPIYVGLWDGTPVATGTVTNMYAIEAQHTYAGPVGTVWTATLTVTNTGTGESASKQYYVKMENKTLPWKSTWPLMRAVVSPQIAESICVQWVDYGTWTSCPPGYNSYACGIGYYSLDPANLNAFEVNGHLESGDPSNPYVETVQRGMRQLFAELTATAIGSQTNHSAPSA